MGLRSAAEMHGGTNDLCVEELSAGESSATRTKGGGGRIGPPEVGIATVIAEV